MTPEQQAAIAAARARRAAKPQQETASGLLDSFTQGATFGFGDELTGLEAAVLGKTPEGGMFDYSKPFGERYQTAVDAERTQQAGFSEANSVLSTGAEIAGSVATGMGAGKAGLTLLKPGMSTGGAIGRGAAEGAAYGALYGAGEADGGDRAAGALAGGAAGAAVGGASSAAISQISRILANRTAAAQAPSVQSLKGQAGAAYDRARAVDPPFPGFDQFATQAYKTLADEGYNIRFHPQLAAVLDDVEAITKGGTAPTLKTLEQLRRRFEAAAGANMGNADQIRLARMGKRALDNYMETVAAAGAKAAPAIPGQGSATTAQALRDVQEGRSLYARAKKGETIERMFEMAEDRAGSTYSGANSENAIRQNLRKILDNPKLSRQFNAAEIDAIRLAVRGEPLQNVMRKIGSLSPLRGGLMSVLMGGMAGTGALTGNPFLLAPAGVAAVADSLARAGTRSQAQAVSSMVRGGPKAAQTINQAAIPAPIAAIIRALSAQTGAGAANLVQ